MNRGDFMDKSLDFTIPRASGDEPNFLVIKDSDKYYSPRQRG